MKSSRLLALLAVVSALAYWSWPLGFWLNPYVAHHLLASQLEAPGAPYNWLFIGADVVCGLSLILAGGWQLHIHKTKLTRASAWCYSTFGLTVAVAAITPLPCDPGAAGCSIWHSPVIILHGFCSIVSVLFLLASLLIVAVVALQQRWSKPRLSVLGLSLLGWAIFGIIGLVELIDKTKGNQAQYFFITVCSLSIIVSVLYTNKLNH